MNLSEKIMMLRKKEGWSQEELANHLQISRQAVSNRSQVNRCLIPIKLFNLANSFK